MNAAESFFDTNVLLYTVSADALKADRAEALLEHGGVISAQVLNEFAAVASRKLRMRWTEITDALDTVRMLCRVESLSTQTHDRAIDLAERYELPIYDACIAASALLAGCKTLYSEDFQDGQVLDKTLVIRNPFAVQTQRPAVPRKPRRR